MEGCATVDENHRRPASGYLVIAELEQVVPTCQDWHRQWGSEAEVGALPHMRRTIVSCELVVPSVTLPAGRVDAAVLRRL